MLGDRVNNFAVLFNCTPAGGSKSKEDVILMYLGPREYPGVGRNTFLSSPHLCFIIVFICDLFVSRDDPLMS